MGRRTGGVLKRDQHTRRRPDGFAYTFYGQDLNHCAICGQGNQYAVWRFHFNVARGLIIVAATCCDAHTLEFEVYHRDEIEAQWANRVLQPGETITVIGDV